MASVYDVFMSGEPQGLYDFDNANVSLKMAVLSGTYSFSGTHSGWSDVSGHEVVGAGYTAGGKALTNVSITVDAANNEVVIDADDVEWTNSSITGDASVLYQDNAGDSSKYLIAYFDFGGTKSSSNGTFKIVFDGSGLVRKKRV